MRNIINTATEALGLLQGKVWQYFLWSKQDVFNDGKTAQPGAGRCWFCQY